MSTPRLDRSISLPLLVLYGLGTTIGAGIYALTGAVAGRAGMLAPLSFVGAALLASFSGLSFAELAARYPKSAGEAEYVRRAFGSRAFALCIGLGVVAAGSISAATVSIGFAGYLGEVTSVPRWLSIVLLTTALWGVAVWGVRESLLAAGLITVIEVAGLLLILWVTRDTISELPNRLPEFSWVAGSATPILAGSALAFFAFLGFEDIVNMAEEVREPRRDIPRAIVWTLLLTTTCYILVSLASVLTVSPRQLASSDAPLAEVWRQATGTEPRLMAWIGVLAMINGALIQIVMASRVLYGLAGQGVLPARLGRVHPRTHTPAFAIGVVALGVGLMALNSSIERLAGITSLVALCVFASVNASLWRIHRTPDLETAAYNCPPFVPIVGLVSSLGLVVFELARLIRG